MKHLLFLFALTLVACGDSSDDASLDTFGDSFGDDGYGQNVAPWEFEQPSEVNHVETAGSANNNSAVCLDGVCNPPPELLLHFSNPTSLTPDGCIASKLSMHDIGTGLMAFVTANCDGAESLFAVPVTYGGVRGVAKNINVCESERIGLQGLQAAYAHGDFMVTSLCRDWNNVYRAYASVVNSDGTRPSFKLLGSITSSSSIATPLVAWNESVSAYGVAWNSRFWRLNKQGEFLGGTTTVPTESSRSFMQLESFAGSWSLRQEHPTSEFYTPTCSKINAVGSLQCDRKPIEFGYGTTRIVGEKWWLSVRTSGDALLKPFDPSTCETDAARSLGKIADTNVSVFYDAKVAAKNYLAVLFAASTPALQLAFFDIVGQKRLTSIPVMDSKKLTQAQLIESQGKYFVSAVRDGDAVISIGMQRAK